ncbi:MAG: hypothetical protein K6F34_06410 [Lachnospiraceae bacterium]|nr:hypothetical protein [Lachnospiraceae bacterium]
MYDRKKSIIKWYEYDATKLYMTAESEDVTEEENKDADKAADGAEPMGNADGAAAASGSGDPALDDEVSRIMAAFSNAKQDSVDEVFAMMSEGPDEEYIRTAG